MKQEELKNTIETKEFLGDLLEICNAFKSSLRKIEDRFDSIDKRLAAQEKLLDELFDKSKKDLTVIRNNTTLARSKIEATGEVLDRSNESIKKLGEIDQYFFNKLYDTMDQILDVLNGTKNDTPEENAEEVKPIDTSESKVEDR